MKNKVKQSVKLSEEEKVSLKDARENYDTIQEFADSFGINRATIGRVLLVGSGSDAVIKTIRKKLKV